jgi:hypothetical protein
MNIVKNIIFKAVDILLKKFKINIEKIKNYCKIAVGR